MNSHQKQTKREKLACECGGWQHARCRYCNRPLEPQHATLDHITPRCLGGGNGLDNLVLACRKCNHRRGDKPFLAFVKRLPRAPGVKV